MIDSICTRCGDDHQSKDCPLPALPLALAILPACLGGWCTRREQCGRHLTAYRDFVVERLCQRGHEQPEPIDLAAWVSAAMLADQPLGASA